MHRLLLILASLLHAGAIVAAPAAGAQVPAGAASVATPEGERAARAVLEALDAVVRVKVSAVQDARTLRTLGREREGSGIVLSPSGLVLTIGYLILEADSISLTDNNGKTVSASVAAYDHASGFGLIKPSVPLAVKGASLGDSGEVAEFERLIFATHGGKENATLATVPPSGDSPATGTI